MYGQRSHVRKGQARGGIVGSTCRGLYSTAREFCLETSIHGFNHLAERNRHWLERLFWCAITFCAITMVVNISRDQWTRYNENPTVVTLEKDFRNWRFPLPGITECAANKMDRSKAEDVIKSLWGVSAADDAFSYYLSFVNTVANSNLTNLSGFKQYADDKALDVDLYELAVAVMPEQIVKPTWVDSLNPRWLPVMTEAGVCYSTNSVAVTDILIRESEKNETRNFPVNCKYASFSCYVTLEVGTCVKLFFHSPYDVADTSAFTRELCTLLNRNVGMSVVASVGGVGVRELAVDRRRCLYTEEHTNAHTQIYSMNMCRRSCRNSLAIKLCGCKPFYNKYEVGDACGPAGMACLSGHEEVFRQSVECTCTPQCMDAVYQELSFEETIWDRGVFVNRGSVRIALQAPRERYTREIVFHFQDLVVSFGGAAGFFLGASFLSFVEIFYFILERVFMLFCKRNPTPTSSQEQPVSAAQSAVLPMPSYEERRILQLTNLLNTNMSC